MSGDNTKERRDKQIEAVQEVFMVKVALGSDIGEIIFFTDSTIIALSWCRNHNVKLRLFMYNSHNRVMPIPKFKLSLVSKMQRIVNIRKQTL